MNLAKFDLVLQKLLWDQCEIWLNICKSYSFRRQFRRQFSMQNYMETGWELTSELTSKGITFTNIQSNFTLISLITFEVLIKTFPNLQGSSRNSSRWCLQNNMENGWELTSELTSKLINFTNIQSNFTLISLITFELLNQTSPNLQGSCRNTSRWCLQIYMENGWELTSEFTSKWITFTKYSIKFHTDLNK